MTKAAKFDAFLAENKITCFYGSKRANAADNGCCR